MNLKFEINSDVGYTKIEKRDVAQCVTCGSFTSWYDLELKKYACSWECDWHCWREVLSNDPQCVFSKRKEVYSTEMKSEIFYPENYSKAILIVAHNQHEYLEKCLSSIKKYTSNYKIYLWDNSSCPKLSTEYRSEENLGFIIPNNLMAKDVEEDVIICLNSDTEVFDGWTNALCTYLDKGYSQVGYLGCYLDDQLSGNIVGFGEEVDYILGWAFAIKRQTYKSFGLFDERFEFAYFEDVDLSLRLKKAGEKIYALYNPLVHHYGNKTVNFNTSILNYIKNNYKKFYEKWSDSFVGQKDLPNDNIWGSFGKKIEIEKK